MTCDNVLFLFLPSKLLFFEIADIFYFFAFLDESVVSLVIDLLKVLHILLSLSLCMIIYLKRSLRPHEIWIRVIMVSITNLLPGERKPNKLGHIWVLARTWINFIAKRPRSNVLFVENV